MAFTIEFHNPGDFTELGSACNFYALYQILDDGLSAADGTPTWIKFYWEGPEDNPAYAEWLDDPVGPAPPVLLPHGFTAGGHGVRGGNGWDWGGIYIPGGLGWYGPVEVSAGLSSSGPWIGGSTFDAGGGCISSDFNLAGPVLSLGGGGGGVDLEWTEPASYDVDFPYTHWVVVRKTTSSPGGGFVLAVTDTPAYLDTTGTPGVTYYYHVIGVTDILADPTGYTGVVSSLIADDMFHSEDSNIVSAVASPSFGVSIDVRVPLKAPS